MKLYFVLIFFILLAKPASSIGLGISPLSINAEKENQTGQIVIYNPGNENTEVRIESESNIVRIQDKVTILPNSRQIIKYMILSADKAGILTVSTESNGIKLEYPIPITGHAIQKINQKSRGEVIYLGLSIILGIIAAGALIFFLILKNNRVFR